MCCVLLTSLWTSRIALQLNVSVTFSVRHMPAASSSPLCLVVSLLLNCLTGAFILCIYANRLSVTKCGLNGSCHHLKLADPLSPIVSEVTISVEGISDSVHLPFWIGIQVYFCFAVVLDATHFILSCAFKAGINMDWEFTHISNSSVHINNLGFINYQFIHIPTGLFRDKIDFPGNQLMYQWSNKTESKCLLFTG